jgi:uncharacterized protein with PIN domain
MENLASFFFHHSLNDFLKPANRNNHIVYHFNGNPAIKDAIEAIGIPHTEVDSILVNGAPINFYYKLCDKDKVEVSPLHANTTTTTSSLTPALVYPLCFIADVHAGKLAKALRMLGFNTVYYNDHNDHEIAEVADTNSRIVLTRDVGLLKHKKINWGHWLRSQHVDEQLLEVLKKFNCNNEISPFKRCIECNGKIEPVKKEEILEFLPAKTKEHFDEFYQCISCRRVYWKGSHYENMLKKIEKYFQKNM